MNENSNAFIVLEIQSNESQVTCIPTAYSSLNDALSKFYQTMISATQSSVPQHTVMILDDIGRVRKTETVYHNEVEE